MIQMSPSGRPRDSYSNLPNTGEFAGIYGSIEILAEAYEFLTVITNNHYRGAELSNAIELKVLISGGKQPVPAGLFKAYPNLKSIALNSVENSV